MDKPKKYATPTAFRRALEDRLKQKAKTAEKECPCGKKCTCEKCGKCADCCKCGGKPCCAESKTYKVTKSHKMYDKLMKKAATGNRKVKLADGGTYFIAISPTTDQIGLIKTSVILPGSEGRKQETPLPNNFFENDELSTALDQAIAEGTPLQEVMQKALDAYQSKQQNLPGDKWDAGLASGTRGEIKRDREAFTDLDEIEPSDADLMGPMTMSASYKVNPDHKLHAKLSAKIEAGDKTVKLADNNEYLMGKGKENTINLVDLKVAKDSEWWKKFKKDKDDKDKESKDMESNETEKSSKSEKIIKESQEKTLNNVKDLQDDPDINQSGKTHADQAHSLGVDEKKPSEGISDPEVPEAPEGGRLSLEHTVEKATEGPSFPAGGGTNPDYDQNKKNTPEKLDQILGKGNDIAAMASNEEAIKIAGQLLKAGQISADELPAKIEELSKASAEILEDYKKLLSNADTKKGMQKEANAGTVESNLPSPTDNIPEDAKGNLKEQIQKMFRLNARNKDYERMTSQKGDVRLY